MNSRLMYHVYWNRAACVYLFLYFFNFLSLKFQNIKFLVTLFCETYKVETWYTHGQRFDLLCTSVTSSQNILVPLFSSFFCLSSWQRLKTCIYKIVSAYLWWLWPGVCELCSLTALFSRPLGGFVRPPALKKLTGHIGFGLCVCACMRSCTRLFKNRAC